MQATQEDILLAYEGWAQSQGIKNPMERLTSSQTPSLNDLESLKKKFPDAPYAGTHAQAIQRILDKSRKERGL